MISKLFFLLFAGGLGGFVGWLVQEPFKPRDVRAGDPLFYGAILGASICLFLGAAGGWHRGSMFHVAKGAILGAVTGFFVGMIGFHFAALVFGALNGTDRPDTSNYIPQLFIRAIAFSFFGAFVGMVEGITARSFRRGLQGTIGGAIGGFIGGFMFNVIADLTAPLQFRLEPNRFRGPSGGVQEIGIFSRAIAFTLMGALIGLFVGLIEIVAKQAWLRVILGRNEGKEYLVDAAVTSIGRAEGADVPLFGDPNVAPVHARIHKQGNLYTLVDAGTPVGSVINGQRVQQARVSDGDTIQIGTFQLTFHERAGAAQKVSRDLRRAPSPPVMVPAGTCAYCGQMKDANGNCACTVQAGAAPPIPTGMPQGAATSVGGPSLVAVDGPLAGLRVPISGTGATLGREPSNTIAMAFDGTASRRHARVAFESGSVVVYDEGSTNGTFVNNSRVTRQILHAGDVVRVGATSFRLEA